MKNRLIPCVLACLMIFLVGCNGNTAKEAAQEIIGVIYPVIGVFITGYFYALFWVLIGGKSHENN